MKKQKSTKKISLNKIIIAQLVSKEGQHVIHGGKDAGSKHVCEHWPTTAGS